MNIDELHEFRRQKDAFFKTHPQSPLTPQQRELFDGLSYYDYDPSLDLEIEVEEFDNKEKVLMQTTTGTVQEFLKWGRFSFDVKGENATLTLFYSPRTGHFFLPFMDATNQDTTYSGGRYLDPVSLGDKRFAINFNLAYAPYCAYNENYTCPIPPKENRLSVRIEAGEKNPTGNWIQHK